MNDEAGCSGAFAALAVGFFSHREDFSAFR
jgi:hypothetical protein